MLYLSVSDTHSSGKAANSSYNAARSFSEFNFELVDAFCLDESAVMVRLGKEVRASSSLFRFRLRAEMFRDVLGAIDACFTVKFMLVRVLFLWFPYEKKK